jgi:phospholipid/cholesterol/gamma-HCH transport system permease protein
MSATTSQEKLSAPLRAPGRVGGLLREAGELCQFSVRAIGALPGTLRFTSEVLRQAAKMAAGTVVLLAIMEAFIGMSVINFGYFFLVTIGAQDYAGLLVGIAGPRVVGPLMFGYVFASRVCGGITAELGAMRINEEIGAYESVGIDPMRYLVGTRVLAAIVFIPIGAAVGLAATQAGSYLEAVVIIHGLAGSSFTSVNFEIQSLIDQIFVLCSVAMVAVMTILVACFYGLRTSGGPAGVGKAVARSLILNIALVHVISCSMAVLFYSAGDKLPIGG